MSSDVGSAAAPRIVPFGERAWLLELGDVVDEALNERVLAIAASIEARRARDGLDAIEPPVPAYASLLVAFDPRRIEAEAVRALLEETASEPSPALAVMARARPLIKIPVRYGGADGPDLDEVAKRLGRAPESVIALHAGTTYRVFMLGFAPGFAYLGTLPADLALPRRAEPRTSVPAGSVAIAARQTAVYPVATPGGWHLIGRTEERLWDPTADPAARLAPGDRVRFVPGLMLEVLEPGLFTTIQDFGRPGLAHLGIRHAGAADRLALVASGLLAGEPPGSPAVEMTLLGATFAVRADCLVGIAGADMGIDVPQEGRSLRPGGSYRLRAGTTLACGAALDGARTYLALGGGIRADHALGSASTDTSAGLGGLGGRPLRVGDVLVPARASVDVVGERRWPPGSPSSGIHADAGPRVIDVLRGPHADRLGARLVDALGEATWTVSARSDRVGVRLDGPALPFAAEGSGELVSLPMVIGAVQVPPDGRPIVLSVDAPTVGGYPVAAVVVEADLPGLGQLRPGDAVRFAWVGANTARHRSAAAADAIAAAARHLAGGAS